jgi:2'-deoxynucleoside 5'-phosphate N-hydrolase
MTFSPDIYFAASIRGGRNDVVLYQGLIAHLQTFGTVLTEHIADHTLTVTGEKDLPDEVIYRRDMGWLTRSQVIVGEVTQPSLGVGYEIGRAVERNLWVPPHLRKRILLLYREQPDRRLSAMIGGGTMETHMKDNFQLSRYTDLPQAKNILSTFFSNFS